MATLPVYDPGGTQRTTPLRPVQVDADMFGAAQGRALAGIGQQLQGVGQRWLAKADEEKQKDQATKVTEATTRASATMRESLFGDGGIYSQTGVNAEGSMNRAREMAEKTKNEIMEGLSSQEEKDAFGRVWTNYTESTLDSVANYEFKQRQATRTTAKASALDNMTSDVIANYDNPDMLKTNFDMARRTIRANSDGLPQEAVDKLERESISNMHLAVAQRLAIDSPGKALDYYKEHQEEFNGVDHAKANSMIAQVGRIRDVKDFVDQTMNAGPANDIVSAVIGAESSGNPFTPPSSAGAAGLMQLMPATAREVAVSLGQAHVAQMTDEELVAYWKTPEGQKMNVRFGRQYLGQQIQRFSKDGKADIEAALIAYNAGPANAEKWLNAGRDYDVLPKKSETLPYVQKVLSAWKGQDFKGVGTSADIQARLKGGSSTYFTGDPKAFLKTRLQSQHGPEAVDGMSDALADRVAAMMNDAPGFVKDGLDILSGYRSADRQAGIISRNMSKYGLDRSAWDADVKSMGAEAAGRKWAGQLKSSGMSEWYGKPGGSQHQHGNASDLGWKGGRFSTAPQEVRDWVKANAASYGLTFPMGHEPWHIETQEARGGKGSRPVAGDYASQRIAGAFGNDSVGGDNEGTVEVSMPTADPANIYMDTVSPFSVDVKIGSLEAALSAARERFADDPDMLAEAERQITATSKQLQGGQEEAIKAMKQSLLTDLLQNGKSPREADPQALAMIGTENIKQLFSLEDDIKGGGTRRTDDATYIELVNMNPAELRNVDLMTYAPRLSGEDLKKFANMQADLKRGNTAAMQSSMQNRQQIVTATANVLGLQPSKTPADAETLMALNRRLDVEVAAHIERTGQQPNGQEIQAMVDGLMIQGKKTGGFFGVGSSGTKDRVFQVPTEELSNFYAASNYSEIPPAAVNQVGQTFRNIFGIMPDETSAVDTYNDMIRVQAGGSPVPPESIAAQIRQAFTRDQGRLPTATELSTAYRKIILRASAVANGQ